MKVLEAIVDQCEQLPPHKAASAVGMILRRVKVAHVWNLGSVMIAHPDYDAAHVAEDGTVTTLVNPSLAVMQAVVAADGAQKADAIGHTEAA